MRFCRIMNWRWCSGDSWQFSCGYKVSGFLSCDCSDCGLLSCDTVVLWVDNWCNGVILLINFQAIQVSLFLIFISSCIQNVKKEKFTFYIHVSTCKRTIISFLIHRMVIIQQEYSHYSTAFYTVHSITFQ